MWWIGFYWIFLISIFPVDTILLTDAASCRGIEVSAFFLATIEKKTDKKNPLFWVCVSDFYQHCKGERGIVCYLHGFKNLLVHNLFVWSVLRILSSIVCGEKCNKIMLSVLWEKKTKKLSTLFQSSDWICRYWSTGKAFCSWVMRLFLL